MVSLQLLMVWLVLVMCPSITICALGATPMFADCSNVNSNFTNSSSGNFEAIGCNYPSKETNISLGLGTGTTAGAYIAYGKVAAGASASLWIQCPPTAISQSLSITITGIAFGQDASFRFTGALPARSSLQISNNSFILTQRNGNTFSDPAVAAKYFTPAIVIGDWGTALVLEEGTTMSAANNTVTCRWAAVGSDLVVAVNVIGASATLRSMSALSMSGNSIANSSFSINAVVAYLYLYSYSDSILALSNQSSIAMSGNNIVSSSVGSSNSYVAYLYLSSSSSILTLSNHSAITMSDNSIVNSSFISIGSNAYVAYLYLSSSSSSSSSLTLYNKSIIAMTTNSLAISSFSGDAYVAYLHLFSSSSSSSLTLYNKSIIAMTTNSLAISSFSGEAYVAYLHLFSSSSSSSSSNLTLSNQSTITMSGNSIANSSLRTAIVAYVTLTSFSSSSLALSNQSAITMSTNNIANSRFSGGNAYVAYLYLSSSGGSSFTLSNQSAIAISGNSIANSNVSLIGNALVAYYAYVAHLSLTSSSSSSLTLSNQSTIAISGNSIVNSSFSSSAYVACLYLAGAATFGKLSLHLSAIIISHNSASSVAARTFLLFIEATSIYLIDSEIEVRSNTLVSVSAPTLLNIIANVTGLPPAGSTSSDCSLIIEENVVVGIPNSSSAPAAILFANLSSLSLVKVSLNEVTGIPALASVGSLHLANGRLIVSDNKLGAFGINTTLISVSGYDNICPIIVMDGNTIDAPLSNYSHMLLKADKWLGNDTFVHACDNYISSTPVLEPSKYFEPKSFLKFDPCLPTGSPSLGLTSSPSVSTMSSIFSVSGSMSPTRQSNTSKATKSLTLVDIPATTHRVSSNVSATSGTGSLSPSTSNPTTLTSSPSNISSTIAPTTSQASCSDGLAICSIGVVCQLVKVASDQSALFDTCTDPGPTDTAAKDSIYVPLAKYIGNEAKKAAIRSSYQGPALSGNAFYYGSVGVLWPEGMANVTHVAAASPAIAACWMHARNANATEIRFAVEALSVAAESALDSASVPVVLMDLTLNVSCGAAAIVFNRTIAMERPVVYLPKQAFVPGKAVQGTAATTGALSVTVGAVAVPIAAMQQGVALALLRMAQCEKDALNGEPLDVSVHPLQFGLGVGSGKYGRGALVGNLLVVPAIWCALMYLLVPFAIRALTDRTLDGSRDFVGWPGMALMPLAVLSEGSSMASVGLLTQGSVGDIIMGLVGLAILLVATACWAAELWRMRRQVALHRASSVDSWAKVIHPRFEWEVGKKKHDGNTSAIASYLDKRIQLVGSSWWLWSALTAHVLSMVVGVAESLPVNSGMCRARWAVASLAAVLQAAAVMTNSVPVELLLLGVIGAMSCILVVLITLSTFDVGSPGSTFSALNAVGMANSILGIALIGIGAGTGAYEIVTQRSRRALSAQTNTQGPATLLSLLSVPMIPQQQVSHPLVLTSPPSSEDFEELTTVVPQILRSSRYPDMPAQWASILDDADLAVSERELGKGSALVM